VPRVGGTPQKQLMGCRLAIVLAAAALWSSGSTPDLVRGEKQILYIPTTSAI
jgi:hypothetical protein